MKAFNFLPRWVRDRRNITLAFCAAIGASLGGAAGGPAWLLVAGPVGIGVVFLAAFLTEAP